MSSFLSQYREQKCLVCNGPKAELRQSFSTYIYCMQLRFQSNNLGCNQYSKRMRTTLVATQLKGDNLLCRILSILPRSLSLHLTSLQL
jgi:hypothetical protein